MKYCPCCEAPLDADTEVYLLEGLVIGCRECVAVRYADEVYSEEDLAELEESYIDNALWERGKDERYGL